jgi:hypothetical protein
VFQSELWDLCGEWANGELLLGRLRTATLQRSTLIIQGCGAVQGCIGSDLASVYAKHDLKIDRGILTLNMVSCWREMERLELGKEVAFLRLLICAERRRSTRHHLSQPMP